MSRLAAAVTRFTRSVKGPAIRRRAITRNVAQLAAGVALHGLRLAVAREVVRAAALVASRGTASSEAAAEASVAASRRAACSTSHSGVGAVAGKVAVQTTAVAASAGAGSAKAQRRAVGLDVAETLAVVALLGWRGVSEVEAEDTMYDVLSVVRGWGHPLDSWPGCLPVHCQYAMHSLSKHVSPVLQL